jgi:hypothetical protein
LKDCWGRVSPFTWPIHILVSPTVSRNFFIFEEDSSLFYLLQKKFPNWRFNLRLLKLVWPESHSYSSHSELRYFSSFLSYWEDCFPQLFEVVLLHDISSQFDLLLSIEFFHRRCVCNIE